MQSLIVFITIVIFAIHIHLLIGLPLSTGDSERIKRSDESLFANGNFSVVTDEKLSKLKELADVVNDPKINDLYRAVSHYVQLAKNNNEHVLWKYDANKEGLVLILKQNVNRILYYG